MSKSKFVRPVLKGTTIEKSGNNPKCRHRDTTILTIDREPSGDQLRPYLATERVECKSCKAVIQYHWETAYRNYSEGVEAMGFYEEE